MLSKEFVRCFVYEIKVYKTESGNVPFEKYIEKLVKKHKDDEVAEIKLYLSKLGEHGFEINQRFKPNAIKLLREQVYELRPSSSRVFFFCYQDGAFVILHGYEKKTNKTNKNEIALAIREKKDFLSGGDR